MAGTHRIKSAAGRWASGGWGEAAVGERQWISEDMVALWERAAETGDKAKQPELFEAIRLAYELGHCVDARQILLPMGLEEKAAYAAALASRKKEFMSSHRGSWRSAPSEAEWRSNLRWTEIELTETHSKKRDIRYVRAPNVDWVSTPGDAGLFDPKDAFEGIAKAALAIQLRKILPKARAQCKKLGFEESELMAPMFEHLGIGTKELSTAKSSAFAAAEEFEQKTAIAIYADSGEGGKGFADKRGAIKNDIAEACLFPDKKKALAFARRYVGDCHAVEVVVSAIAYAPLLGTPDAAPDLSAVIASRERRELEQVLERAKVEELEAELERRRSEAKAAGEAPAAEERPKRSSRL